MASVSRFKRAQKAESKYYKPNHKPLPNSYLFFYQNFPLIFNFDNKEILEIGCTPLAHIHDINEALTRVGIDPLAGLFAKEYDKKTSHVQSVGENLPFKDQTFSIILCINVLDHVYSPSALLHEVRRCLKNDGILIMYLQTFKAPSIIRKAMNHLDKPHPHHFNCDDVSFILKQAELRILYQKCIKAEFHNALHLQKTGYFVSGLKSMFANLFFGLCNSYYICH